MKRKAHAVSAEDIKQFVKMYTHGYTLEQIAEVTGWGHACIGRNLRKAGINLYKPGTQRRESK